MKKVGPPIRIPEGFVASEYEIVANVIRPTAGAELTKQDLSREESGQDPPYIALFDAVGPAQRFDPGPQRSRRLPPSTTEQILAWCRQFGLLGLLPQELTAYAPIGAFPWVSHGGGRWGYVTGGPEWLQEGKALLGNAPIPKTVNFTDPGWFRYFPHVRWNQRSGYGYSPPNYPAFWAEYGEPVEWFIGVAIRLRDALRTLAPSMPGGPAKEQPRDWAQVTLSSLLLSAKLEVDEDADARPALSLTAPSLLGRLAYRATRDLTAGWIRDCQLPECRRIFLKKSGAWYCSEKHYDVARKRGARKSGKEKT